MSVQNDIFLKVIELAQSITPAPYASIVIGGMPASNGLAAQVLPSSSPQTTFMTKGMVYTFYVELLGKHQKAQVVSDTLNNIHLALTQTKDYPKTDNYQITNIATGSSPFYLNREESQWLYGSTLLVEAFIFN